MSRLGGLEIDPSQARCDLDGRSYLAARNNVRGKHFFRPFNGELSRICSMASASSGASPWGFVAFVMCLQFMAGEIVPCRAIGAAVDDCALPS